MKQFRLFVGNIPDGTQERELQQEFEAYGVVSAIEFKTKSDQKGTFGFVSIETDDRTLNQCIKEFSEQKFKGSFLQVSRAKESFLDRLKREREEAERKKGNSSNAPDPSASETSFASPAPKIELPTFKAEVEEDDESSSSSSSDDEPDEPPPPRPTPKPIQKPRDPDELIRKWNSEAYVENGKMKIVQITGDVKEVIDMRKKKGKETKGKKLEADDEKRLKGLESIKNTYDQQKKLIQAALGGGGGGGAGGGKKIVFDDPDEGKKSLFDEDNDDEDVTSYKKDFAIKNQFQGERGEELFQLQAKFKQDNRFALDTRFIDAPETKKDKSGKKQKKSALDKEKEGQLKLLAEMGEASSAFGSREKQKEMIRFDPSKADHYKNQGIQSGSGQKDSHGNIKREDFQVSDEVYVKINPNLKQAFGAGGGDSGAGFSLLQAYGRADAFEDVQENKFEATNGETFPGKRFRYDESDSEDEKPEVKKQKIEKKSSKNIFKESFFFQVDDARFKEGYKFFTSAAPKKTKEEIEESRKSLKQVVKEKVKKQRNRESNKEMFKKSFRKPVGKQFQKPRRKNFNRS